ncbi:MAG: PKD domain-containing protein, partial [Betaproteobacteria bacterium]|nr:PKD domain-containing protein [Betaproteobacteria bacterium]
DYWAVDFDYQSRKEIIRVVRDMGVESAIPAEAGIQSTDKPLDPGIRRGDDQQFEERWTGGYIFENEWQSFRTRQDRKLELVSAPHTYTRPGRYTAAVKVIDIFGNDTMTLVPVSVG